MAGTLSGGEQQMLVIGRALISRPSVWVLDEPFLGLVVDGHGAHGRTIADRVMTLHEGRLSPADDG